MKLIYLTLLTLVISLTSGSSYIGRLPRGEQEERSGNTVGIINGKKASIKQFPFLASFKLNSGFFGSGVILNKHWILTTAFNVAWDPVSILSFRVGSNRYDRGGQLLRVSKVVYHPQYSGFWDYNVAVVKVTKPIKFGKNVKSIRLGTKNLKKNTKAVVVGWGGTSINGTSPSPTLRSTVVKSITWKKCHITYKTILTPRIMCTYDQQTGPSIYDFGDPLIYKNALYGLFSGGYGYLSNPALYTDIPSLNKWIQSAIKQ